MRSKKTIIPFLSDIYTLHYKSTKITIIREGIAFDFQEQIALNIPKSMNAIEEKSIIPFLSIGYLYIYCKNTKIIIKRAYSV